MENLFLIKLKTWKIYVFNYFPKHIFFYLHEKKAVNTTTCTQYNCMWKHLDQKSKEIQDLNLKFIVKIKI